jgi:hypothetical protein
MVTEGTPGTVKGLRTMPNEALIDDSDVRTETFAGN